MMNRIAHVRELAEVSVNGRSLGVVWHAPYRIDVSSALNAGANSLEIKVTNLWVNFPGRIDDENVESGLSVFSARYSGDGAGACISRDLLGPG